MLLRVWFKLDVYYCIYLFICSISDSCICLNVYVSYCIYIHMKFTPFLINSFTAVDW